MFNSFQIFIYSSLFSLAICGCKTDNAGNLFQLTDGKDTGITFENNVPYTEEFNTYTYRNFYNGGGVALGDINNDGLTDIFFTGNMVDSKLFLNQGNWKFKDITAEAGVACHSVWSTGVTLVDINHDGFLDIYVCKAGKPEGKNRHNELFINQGNLKFIEKSADYGLNLTGLSIHSSFFDFDRDGDLDCYILKNSLRSVGGFDFVGGQREIPDSEGNQLLRNDNGKFVDVSSKAGIYTSKIGYGLGITVSDFNLDAWPDLFISNDFFEKDYMYINQRNGTFKEVSDSCFMSMSMGSMGADASDLDNDLLPDIFVTEMLPRDPERKKTKNQYDSWDKYESAVKNGYHHQYSRNALHKNMGNGQFVEISRLSGVADTDWSWSALAQDYNNDGFKDIYVTNGIFKDLLDKDYLAYEANGNIAKSKIDKNTNVLTKLIDSMPSVPVVNCMFSHKGDYKYAMVSSEWGMDQPGFSNGSAYGDLDNDGDLDLVVNNVNSPSFVYKNNTDTSIYHSVSINLKATGSKNTNAIGAKVIASYNNGQKVMLESYNSRGFLSSVDPMMIVGVGQAKVIDTLTIIWPNGMVSYQYGLKVNKSYTYEMAQASAPYAVSNKNHNLSQIETEVPFKHKDIDQNLFAMERLLVEMSGFTGPSIAVGDVNGDKIEDVFYGGGKNQSSELHRSVGDKFDVIRFPFEPFAKSEVTKAKFFDADNDGDLDLYIAHGGKSFSEYSSELDDILMVNNGLGDFTPLKINFPKPICTGDIDIGDVNKDGLLDIVVAEQIKPSLFGLKCDLYILYNRGGLKFDVQLIKSATMLGMMTSVALLDTDKDGFLDIVTAGRWMPIFLLKNQNGSFDNAKPIPIEGTSGLWNVISKVDIDDDGDLDLICGNQGLNSFVKPTWRMYIEDFDNNGGVEQIICEEVNKNFYPIHDLDELYSQMPGLKKKYRTYNQLSSVSIDQMFGKETIDGSEQSILQELQSCIFINSAKGFLKIPLPIHAQYSSIYAIGTKKKTNGKTLFLGGNTYRVKPQFGRFDASMGWQIDLKNKGELITFASPQSLYIKGEIRSFQPFGSRMLIGLNNSEVLNIKN